MFAEKKEHVNNSNGNNSFIYPLFCMSWLTMSFSIEPLSCASSWKKEIGICF